jgi:hypothetical protein
MLMNRLWRFAERSIAWRGERRAHGRHDTPSLTLMVGRRKFAALDWSLGGCRIAAEPGEYRRGNRLEGTLWLDGCPRGEFLAEFVRGTETGEYGLRWLEITASTFVAMAESKAF